MSIKAIYFDCQKLGKYIKK